MEYEYYGQGDAFTVAFLASFLITMIITSVIVYLITSIFLMKILKNANHKNPVAAWVPLWNTVTLFELAGIRTPWAWVAILFGGGLLSGIPVIGVVISVGVMILSIILTIWMAKGVQAGLGLESVGGIVLAVFIPLIWIIWMSVRSNSVAYNHTAAFATGSTLPISWFNNGDPAASFNIVAAPPTQSGF